MYPLLELGSIRLSVSGLVLLAAVYWWSVRVPVAAAAVGGVQWVERTGRCVIWVLVGSLIGARLWHGLFHWDAYAVNPWRWLSLQTADFVWPGGLIGGLLALLPAARRVKAAAPVIADAIWIALGPPQALAAFGTLLGGEALGVPANVPWAIYLLGEYRHPTQLYYVLAAALTWVGLRMLARQFPIPGMIAAAGLALQGVAWLLIEPLRIDTLRLPGGLPVAQVLGLILLGVAGWWVKRTSR
jgi:phosphatidylglycerol---prolipoprotein diacylglyceryl transferase